MKDPRFKSRSNVNIITIYRKNFTAEEEVKWDNWYLDKAAIIDTFSWNDTMCCYEYRCRMREEDLDGTLRSGTFYEFELDFDRRIY